jgi:hypothetical protein
MSESKGKRTLPEPAELEALFDSVIETIKKTKPNPGYTYVGGEPPQHNSNGQLKIGRAPSGNLAKRFETVFLKSSSTAILHWTFVGANIENILHRAFAAYNINQELYQDNIVRLFIAECKKRGIGLSPEHTGHHGQTIAKTTIQQKDPFFKLYDSVLWSDPKYSSYLDFLDESDKDASTKCILIDDLQRYCRVRSIESKYVRGVASGRKKSHIPESEELSISALAIVDLKDVDNWRSLKFPNQDWANRQKPKRKYPNFPPSEQQRVVDLYLVPGATINTVGKETGYSYHDIRNVLMDHDVEFKGRESDEARIVQLTASITQSNQNFGEKITFNPADYKGQSIPMRFLCGTHGECDQEPSKIIGGRNKCACVICGTERIWKKRHEQRRPQRDYASQQSAGNASECQAEVAE